MHPGRGRYTARMRMRPLLGLVVLLGIAITAWILLGRGGEEAPPEVATGGPHEPADRESRPPDPLDRPLEDVEPARIEVESGEVGAVE